MRGPHRALAILLLGLAAAHLTFAEAQPEPRAWGDEGHYARLAARDVREGERGLLPGDLRPAVRPELVSRVWSYLSEPRPGAELSIRATRLNLALFLVVVAATFFQGRVLGLSGWSSFLAAALLGSFSWFSFYVHTLWPQMIHAAMVSIGLLALFAFLRRPRVDLLVVVGLMLGYAQLTKSSVGPFSWLAVVAVAVCTHARSRDLPARRRLGRAGIAAAVLAGTLALTVVPQMRANDRAGFGFGLGANRWWNLELAIRTPPAVPGDDELGTRQHELQQSITLGWWGAGHEPGDADAASSDRPRRRERLARERTLAHVREQGWGSTAVAQGRKFLQVLFACPSLAFYRLPALEQALGQRARWGASPPGWIGALAAPARPTWYALLVLGMVGLTARARRDPTWIVPLVFVLCGLMLVALVPIKFRFLLPVVPVLCIGAAALAERLYGTSGEQEVVFGEGE